MSTHGLRPIVILAIVVCSMMVAASARDARQRSFRASETQRLRAHFDQVDRELRARAVRSLSAEQRVQRAALVAWLRDYRDSGRFPRNESLPYRAPFFRDSYGVLCAMAYLIDRSGHGDLVDRVARTRNNAYIAELADDRDLVAWLDTHGLTAEEAARIQPEYGNGLGIEPDRPVSPMFATASGVALSTSLSLTTINLVASTPQRALLGVVVGLATMAASASGVDESGATGSLAHVDLAVGATTTAVSLVRLILHSRKREEPAPTPTRVSLAPAFSRHGGGVMAAVEF